MSAVQLNIIDAIEERDKGIKQATDHANAVNKDWSEKALAKLKEFISFHTEPFQAEEVRSFAAMDDEFPLPPHERAWGGVIKSAAFQRLIRKIGLAPTKNVKSHCANAALWQKV